jgi:hypothetical protein
MPIPELLPNGYLPPGVHVSSQEELRLRFGSRTVRRQYLWARVARRLELGRKVGASKLLIDGSFVTSKDSPNDVDAVIFLTDKYDWDFFKGTVEALELHGMFVSKEPEEIFAAEDQEGWMSWVDFFSRIQENQEDRKGLVEVPL